MFFLFPSIFKKHKISITTVTILFFVVGILLLYNYRPKSADGRLLIWRVSCGMIADRPLTGHGAGAFAEKYMLYQAAFFEQHPESRFVLVAGNAEYPFNELLNSVICFGIIGTVLLLFLLWTVFRGSGGGSTARHCGLDPQSPKKELPIIKGLRVKPAMTGMAASSIIFKAGLASWLAFAMFSYPLGVFPLLLLGITCLSGIESNTKLSFKLPRWFYGAALLFLTVVLLQAWRDTTALKRLSGALINLRQDMALSTDEVEDAYAKMKANSTFNNHYMSWMESLPVELYTANVKDVLPSCEGYCMKGKYYLQTGDMEQAEQAFHTATHMVPARIRPKYLLWQFYVEKGDTAAAKKTAQKILDTPVKIESVFTLKVKSEMRKYGE
jgi:hypothetical protein